MKTLFDLVGKFGSLVRNVHTSKYEVRTEYIVLVPDLEPNMCTKGPDVLAEAAKQSAKQYIVPGRFWFVDWMLREKKVPEDYQPQEESAQKVA